MHCPKCGGPSAVIDTYSVGNEIKRTRKCATCKYRFFSLELTLSDELSRRIGARIDVYNRHRRTEPKQIKPGKKKASPKKDRVSA